MNLVNLIMIRLTGNKIRSIDRYGFTNVPKLRFLFLDQNELTSIQPNVLQQFKFLEIINLSFNNIAEIPADAFKGLEHLMQLNLEGNTIKDIAPGAFSQTQLLLLLLGHNCLSSITTQMFQVRYLGIPRYPPPLAEGQGSLAPHHLALQRNLSAMPLSLTHSPPTFS